MTTVSWRIKNSNGTYDLATNFAIIVRSHLGTGLPTPNVVSTPFGLADGSLPQRIVIPERRVKLMATINGGTPEGLLQAREAFINEISRDAVVDDDGVLYPLTLQYLFNGATIEIDALYTTGMEDGAVDGQSIQEVPLEFKCPDPFWRSPTASTVSLTANTPTVVSNGGNTRNYPVIALTGQGQIESLVNTTTNQTIYFTDLSVIGSETITINLTPGQKKIISNVRGLLNATISDGSDFSTWSLRRGQNTILLTVSGEVSLQTETGENILTESGQNILVSDTLNASGTIQVQNRYWSIDSVAKL